MEQNMKYYEAFRKVPDSAKKEITAGRLRGMTDVSPMWRIKILTEVFGPCGIGWKTINEKYSMIHCENTKEIVCIYELDLIFKEGESWSEPIHGVGGSLLVAVEKNGLHTDDEAVKKAKTDALSVAAKALGVAADVYYEKDRSKYDTTPDEEQGGKPKERDYFCTKCNAQITRSTKRTAEELALASADKFGRVLCKVCANQEIERIEMQETNRDESFTVEALHEDTGDRT